MSRKGMETASLIEVENEESVRSFDVHYEVYVPSPYPKAFILGPCFKGSIPKHCSTLYPDNRVRLPFQSSPIPLSTSLPDRPYPSDEWRQWVRRIKSARFTILHQAGIYDVIDFSLLDIQYDYPLIISALQFWCHTTNSFHFHFGMLSPTLYDVAALTSLHVTGPEVTSLTIKKHYNFNFPREKKGTSVPGFIKSYRKIEGAVDDEELIAFLLVWLCKYLLCVPAHKVTKEYLPIAMSLAEGQALALCPFVLSHLLRGCYKLTQRASAVGGPFWLLQLWLLAYFPELGPPLHVNGDSPNYGYPLACSSYPCYSFSHCFSFFYSLTVRPFRYLMPFIGHFIGPSYLFNIFGSKPIFNEDRNKLWASFLTCRGLPCGSAFNMLNPKHGLELYAPNQFARQFGFVQAIPFPPLLSDVKGGRVVHASVTDVQASLAAYQLAKEGFCAQSFTPAVPALTTPAFDEWWSEYCSRVFSENGSIVLRRLLSFFDDQLAKKTESSKKMTSTIADGLLETPQKLRDGFKQYTYPSSRVRAIYSSLPSCSFGTEAMP